MLIATFTPQEQLPSLQETAHAQPRVRGGTEQPEKGMGGAMIAQQMRGGAWREEFCAHCAKQWGGAKAAAKKQGRGEEEEA